MRSYSQVQMCSHYLEQRECHPAQTRRRDAQLFAGSERATSWNRGNATYPSIGQHFCVSLHNYSILFLDLLSYRCKKCAYCKQITFLTMFWSTLVPHLGFSECWSMPESRQRKDLPEVSKDIFMQILYLFQSACTHKIIPGHIRSLKSSNCFCI